MDSPNSTENMTTGTNESTGPDPDRPRTDVPQPQWKIDCDDPGSLGVQELPPACGARPAASLASRGKPRAIACAVQAVPARRTRPGRPAHSAPGRPTDAAPHSDTGAPAARHPWQGRCGSP